MNQSRDAGLFRSITLVRQQAGRIRDLKGFRKGHQIPSDVSEHTQ